jgi:beta-glucanase (GH16 family)
VAPVWSKPQPLVRIIKAPPARTTATTAVFRFKTRATSTACRRDDRRYTRCRASVRYERLRPGRHTFIVRARHRGRTSFVRRTWTVLPAESAPPSSEPAPADSAQGRKLLFADEFDGTEVDTTAWKLYDSPGNAGHGLRRPSAFSLDGQGNLVVTAQMANDRLVSGGMANRLEFTYGRVEFRVKTEQDPTGTMSGVVLTWPDHQLSPEFTENDMYETGPHVNNDRFFKSFIHFGEDNRQRYFQHDVDPSQWHTVAMEWQRDRIEIYVDGRFAWRVSEPEVIPDIMHHVCIQLDARATRALTRPVRMYVDYLRVYE